MNLETLEPEYFYEFEESEALAAEATEPCCKACGRSARPSLELEDEAPAAARIAFRLDCGIGCAPNTAARCHAVLQRTVARAVWLANNAAEKLEANQRDPSQAVPHFRRLFGHDPSRPVPWADNQPSGAVIAKRYRAVARAFQWPGGRVPHFVCSTERDYDGKSDGSAWPLRRARVNAVARTTRANGPSSSSGEEARLGPGGTFSTATQIGFDGAPARFSMVVRLELSRSKTVEASIELKLAELDIARFLATVDPRESARPASQTHAQFLSSVRKLYQGGAGDPLGSLFDWVLDKNARVKALFAPTTAEWKWLSSHPVLYADGEVADIGHVLTGIEGVLEQARIDERDLPRPIRPDLIVTWAGDLGSVFQYHMPEIVDAVAQGRAPDFAGYLQRRASRSDLIGDIDGINIGSSYDPSQTLAANLNAYYGKRSLGRFHEFIRSSLDDSGRPAIPLLAGSGLPKISAQGRRWIAFSVRRYLVYFYVLGRLSKGVPASQEKLVDQIVAEGSPQLAAVAEYFARFLEEGLQREL